MKIDKTGRDTLKSYFVKNAVPTASNFEDLINAGLNQREDGIAKLPGEPLSLQADGDDASQKKLLNLYRSFNDLAPAWALALNPRANPADPASANAGFSISDANGVSRLFIDQATGRLGVGTVTPSMRLDVSGVVRFMANHNASKDPDSRLQFGGNLVLKGNAPQIDFLDADHNEWAIHVNSNKMYFIREPWVVTDLVLDGAGNIGMGTDAPRAKLEVRGGAIMPSFGDSAAAGISWPSDAAGGSGDNAWMRYFSRGGESCTLELGIGNDPDDHIALMASGGVGIGTRTPRTALDTGTGLLSGAANDYQKAQFNLSGGGLVTWDGPNGYLKWTSRFIAISMERGKTFSSGHINITLPTSAALVTASDGSSRLDPQRGIKLKDWEALYAVHETGKDPDQLRFQIVVYTDPSYHAPSNWLLVAVVNSDDGTVKLGSGVSVGRSSSYAASQGAAMPRGAIIMWSGDTAPDSWALCDGANGTPDLRGRFVLAAGAGAGLTQRTRAQTGGKESHVLSQAEMPVHGHGVSDPGHFHNWTGSRQQAGTDDNNNTQEFSKGDRGAADTVSKNTDSRGTGISINSAGGNAAHENMPPFYVLAYIFKL